MEKRRQDDLVLAMQILGFEIDRDRSKKGEIYFRGKGQIMKLQSWELLEEWLNRKYYNSRNTQERVEFVLYPERFVRVVHDCFDNIKEH